MAEEAATKTSVSKLSVAFQLGFFGAYFDPDMLVEALEILRTRIAPSMQRRLKEAIQRSGDPGERNDSFVAVADCAIAAIKAPYRTLYELGMAMGDYEVRALGTDSPPDAAAVWQCVRRLPDWLIGLSACLHDLAEEAKSNEDLSAVIARATKPIREMFATDDEDQFARAWGTILAGSPAWVQRAIRRDRYSDGIMFVSRLNHELAEATGILRKTRQIPPSGAPAKPKLACQVETINAPNADDADHREESKKKQGEWAHHQPPPANGKWHGPVQCTLKALAKCLHVNDKTLRNRNEDGTLYIVRQHGRKYWVWFRTNEEHARCIALG